jgi:hypothetical protein
MIGAGIITELSTDGGTVYTPIGFVKDITYPDESRSTSEDSYISDPDLYKSFVAGMFESGDMELILKWNVADAQQVSLNTVFESNNPECHIKLTFTDATTVVFQVLVVGRGREVPKEETITQKYTLKPIAKPIEV